MPLSPERESQLCEIAIERLYATADDEEQWSFLIRTKGSMDYLYYPWSEAEYMEFDPDDLEDRGLLWSEERLKELADGTAEPTEEELQQWRVTRCYELANASDYSWVGWIVPLIVGDVTEAHALFLCRPDVDHTPDLHGAYESFDDAKTALELEGAVAEYIKY